jgi:hypothetical protein
MTQTEFDTAPKLAAELYRQHLVTVKRKRTTEFASSDDIKKYAIGSIKKKIEAHINADTPVKLQGEFVIAYCDLFHCSADYLFGRTTVKTPDITVRSICEETGLSEDAVQVLINSKADDLPLGDWRSFLLEPEPFFSINHDWDSMCSEMIDYAIKLGRLEGKKWAIETLELDSIQKSLEEVEIKTLEKTTSRHYDAIYGLLAKISRDVSLVFENQTQAILELDNLKEHSLKKEKQYFYNFLAYQADKAQKEKPFKFKEHDL